MDKRIVRIGGASGAWGDSPMAIAQLLTEPVDYLVMDYLAEVTMSLLARARAKDPNAGFPPDFVGYLKPHLQTIAQRGIRVISNAGGVNPWGCKLALESLCASLGISIKIAVVMGDDLMPQVEALRQRDVREAVSAAPLPQTLLSANAYLGALPIAEALQHGAQIVITGRCVDSALALGALMHEFGWRADDYDLLAAGSLVGHLLECGPQVTGGLFTDWESVPDWHNIGYPIAECRADGRFIVTKPADTGGIVVPATVAEQVLYEIGDPAAYVLPDVVADFSQVRLESAGRDRVEVTGARGSAPTSQYKVSATFQDGYRAVAMVSIIGHDAVRKAQRTAEALVARATMLFKPRGYRDFSAVHTEVLGAEAAYGTQSRTLEAREVILRLVVDHPEAAALDVFARQLGAVGLSFAPGTTGLIGGRPKPTPLVRLYTFFIPKDQLPPPTVRFDEKLTVPVSISTAGTAVCGRQLSSVPELAGDEHVRAQELMTEVALRQIAHARSGDKGNMSNIAVFCRKPEYMPYLRQILTPERVAAHFAEWVDGPVVRYEAPGLYALNFVLDQALGGGGMASPRLDAQGKAYGQRVLEMSVRVPQSWVLQS